MVYVELPQCGHNNDTLHDIKQVGLAMPVTTDLHIPLLHHVYPRCACTTAPRTTTS